MEQELKIAHLRAATLVGVSGAVFSLTITGAIEHPSTFIGLSVVTASAFLGAMVYWSCLCYKRPYPPLSSAEGLVQDHGDELTSELAALNTNLVEFNSGVAKLAIAVTAMAEERSAMATADEGKS
jgi:hypothetical protein